MKRISYLCLALVALGLLAAGLAFAADGRDCAPPVNTPNPVGVIVTPRIWNDCPGSNLTVTNSYPALVSIEDADEGCVGWGGLHVWAFTEDGVSPAVFENCSHYQFSGTFTISGFGANAEGGLRVAPWWDLNGGGKFMAKTDNGEVACFDGRFPFYSFTAAYGVHYVAGTPIWMQITYNPHQLSQTAPATITFKVYYQGNTYVSPELPFDQANPGEDPPHGLWGELFPARAGGWFLTPKANGGAAYDMKASWTNIQFTGPQATATTNATWGSLKSIYR